MNIAVEVLDLFKDSHSLVVGREQILTVGHLQEEVANRFPREAEKLVIV